MKKVILILFLLFSTGVYTQIKHPKASPHTEIKQDVGLTQITVRYSRPATRGRLIFGYQDNGLPGLVPYGRIWRVGANESTKISLTSETQVMGKTVPKGTYVLYAFPAENEWEIVFHTNLTHWGDGRKAYNPKEDLLRIKIEPEHIEVHQENFLISFDKITHNSLEMLWIWENTLVRIPIQVDTDKLMEKEIAKQLQTNPTAQTYYEASRYLQEQGRDYKRALTYVEKAISLGGNTYYFHRVKSLVEAELGQLAEAIESAKKSMELASTEGKDEFVLLNKKNIAKWKLQLAEKRN